MKNIFKVLVFVFIVTLFVGCYSETSDKSAMIESLDSIKANDPYELNYEYINYHTHYIQSGHVQLYRVNIMVYKFKYNGHTYIMFSNGRSENGVVHDPDCECHKLSLDAIKKRFE